MKKLLWIILLLVPVSQLQAGDLDKVNNALKILRVTSPDGIKKAQFPGFYEVSIGAQVIYISADGRYMIDGDVWNLNKMVNVTEQQRSTGRVKAAAALDEKSLLIFKPAKQKVKYVVTAFTDIDCGYCRKLHKEMAQYNKRGIEIRYASYPRSGIQTPSYFKAVAVWCAKDRNQAMNFAKGGAKLEQLQKLAHVEGDDCKKAIDQHMKIARQIGVSGTPTLLLEDGTVFPGYLPAEQLLSELKKSRL